MLLPILARSLVNRSRRFLRRLRDPRYLAALVAGVLYFGWIFLAAGGDPDRTAPQEVAAVLSELRGIAPFLLAALLGFWWVWGGFEGALAFTPAEVTVLFPAPLSHRTLLRYKLIKLQGGVLFTALLLSLVPRGELPWAARMASWWLLVATLHLHQLGSSLTRNAAARGRGGRWHVVVPLTILGLAVAGLAVTLWLALPELRAAGDTGAVLVVLAETLERPLPRAVLFPLEVVIAPAFADASGPWLRSLPGALLVLAAHYVWVMAAGSGFQEAAARAGRKRQRKRETLRAGGFTGVGAASLRSPPPSPLPLAPLGEPAVAIFWKNVTAFLRELRGWTLLVIAGTVAALFAVLAALAGSWSAAAGTMAGLTAVGAAALVVVGPLGFRYDLRRDLERVALLKTYPVTGARLVAAELGAAALCLTATQAAALAAAGAFVAFAPEVPVPLPVLCGAAAGALLVLVPLNVVALAAQNAMAVLFPEWIRIGRDRPGGVDHMGRSVLTLSAAVLVTAAALLPPLFAGGATALRLSPLLGAWAALPGGVAGLAVLCGEAALAVGWLGGRFEALEPDAQGLL